jgi:hypothetical protein
MGEMAIKEEEWKLSPDFSFLNTVTNGGWYVNEWCLYPQKRTAEI